jgi:hypothetical protein
MDESVMVWLMGAFTVLCFVMTGYFKWRNTQASAHSLEDFSSGVAAIAWFICGIVMSAATGLAAWLT